MNEDLIMDWDIAVTEYYNQFNRHELELIYFDWFGEIAQEGLDKDTMMNKFWEV